MFGYLNEISNKIKKLHTSHLVNLIYLIFSLPFLTTLLFSMIYFIPEKFGPDFLRLLFVSSVLWGWVGPLIGGIIMIRREEVPPYASFAGLRGKQASIYGGIQMVLSLVVIIIGVIALIGSFK
jgi:hypothetical protein